MKPIHAIYVDGVFRPIEPVELPDHCRVVFEPRVVSEDRPAVLLDDLYALMNRRFESGEADVAARHNEHQP